jgi:hypothetical protein
MLTKPEYLTTLLTDAERLARNHRVIRTEADRELSTLIVRLLKTLVQGMPTDAPPHK